MPEKALPLQALRKAARARDRIDNQAGLFLMGKRRGIW
jgi:hypothetical protein